MIFRQFQEAETDTFTYLLACPDSRKACLIDPVNSEVELYLKVLRALNLDLVYTMDTHVHADHITAADALRQETGSKSVLHRDAGVACADLMVSDGVRLQLGSLEIEVRHTPGHTGACVSYVVGDRVFTGDALLIDGCGRTDFQAGDAGQLYDSIHQKIFSLPAETLVYPGHDYNGRCVSSVGEQRSRNSRLGNNRSREDFVALMDALDLPQPKKIQEALPANMACGRA